MGNSGSSVSTLPLWCGLQENQWSISRKRRFRRPCNSELRRAPAPATTRKYCNGIDELYTSGGPTGDVACGNTKTGKVVVEDGEEEGLPAEFGEGSTNEADNGGDAEDDDVSGMWRSTEVSSKGYV
jgi:hypothetical protein